jgi:hypothetical protein
MSPLVLLGVFATIFTVVPVGPIETLVLDRPTVTPAGATTTRVAFTVVLSVLLSATAIENCFVPTGAIKNPSFPELPLTLRVIAMVSTPSKARGFKVRKTDSALSIPMKAKAGVASVNQTPPKAKEAGGAAIEFQSAPWFTTIGLRIGR